jgi:hypothetical protein
MVMTLAGESGEVHADEWLDVGCGERIGERWRRHSGGRPL